MPVEENTVTIDMGDVFVVLVAVALNVWFFRRYVGLLRREGKVFNILGCIGKGQTYREVLRGELDFDFLRHRYGPLDREGVSLRGNAVAGGPADGPGGGEQDG